MNATNIFLTLILCLCFKFVCNISFEDFASNDRVKNLVEQYFKKEIKTRGALLEKLDEIGVEITLRTLERHLAKMKTQKPKGILENMENAEVSQCYSKFDNKFLFIVGHGVEYRKFQKTNENTADIINARAYKKTKSKEETGYTSQSNESAFSSQETHDVQHVDTLARATLDFVFNPLNVDQREEICETWFYTFSPEPIEYPAPFGFISSEYGPGEVIEILGDGNCGWRSISLALTGTASNHGEIRKDVIEYLEETIYQHSNLNHLENDWWSLFDSITNVREHIEKAINPADGAHEKVKYMKNLDIAAASKMFRINIIVCEMVTNDTYRWQVYSPDLKSSLANISQKQSVASAFLYFHDEHFELIKQPQKIN